jgi:putative transposase
MTQSHPCSTGALWARFRFSVVGSLLSSPPARGALQAAIRSLAQKSWSHPVTGRDLRVAPGTIARWYYTALRQPDDPVGALRRTVRKDCGKISLAAAIAERLHLQYSDHPDWSYQLHYDNVAALVKADPSLGQLPSYSTVKRYMQAHGSVRRPRLRPSGRPGETRAETRRQAREIRSYEATHVGALWHLDFHHGSLKVLTAGGQWLRPIALGILDDHSRLCCHVQWYLSETAEDLVHGLSQAIQKRGLPRALLTDNGSAMVAEEVTEGLLRVGIVHERTLPYSPYQNGKQEAFWGTLEGRLLKMLDDVADLTLELLNTATQAWAEIEYNRAVHRETGSSPVDRFAKAPDVLRSSPSSEALRDAFRLETMRSQRQSDGTISLEGVRFEIPARYRHFREVTVRYARWDLGRIDLVDGRSGIVLAPLYPIDKAANADGRRAVTESGSTAVPSPVRPSRRGGSELPPLLKSILQEYSATGMPPAYLPKTSPKDNGEPS